MVRDIIKIGNSKGIILPSSVLKALQLSENSVVNVFLKENAIVIKPHPRQGWEDAAKCAHKNGDDSLLIPDVFDDEQFEEWTW